MSIQLFIKHEATITDDKDGLKMNCVIYCNFGDNYWVKKNFSSLRQLDYFKHFTIIDQNSLPNSNSPTLTLTDFDDCDFVEIFENPESPYQHASYQHADAVNKVLKKLKCSCERIWIIDTDLFFSSSALDWLDDAMKTYEAIFMQDPVQPFFSHPCLCIINRKNIDKIDFFPTEFDLIDLYGQKVRLIDTGRILAAKLAQEGVKVAIVRKNLERRFNSKIMKSTHHPDFYLDGEIVHFRSMSFSTKIEARQRFRIMDRVRYLYPRRYVDKIVGESPSTFKKIFLFYELKRIVNYLRNLIYKDAK